MSREERMRARLIVSAQFAGKPTVARRRMVYSALGEMLKRCMRCILLPTRQMKHTLTLFNKD